MNPFVHLELHTPDAGGASAFYSTLLSWQPEWIHAGHGSYLALEPGGPVGGGIVECGTKRALWLPYVVVDDVGATTERAVELGAALLVGPRESRAGRRSVVRTPAGGEIAFWEPREDA